MHSGGLVMEKLCLLVILQVDDSLILCNDALMDEGAIPSENFKYKDRDPLTEKPIKFNCICIRCSNDHTILERRDKIEKLEVQEGKRVFKRTHHFTIHRKEFPTGCVCAHFYNRPVKDPTTVDELSRTRLPRSRQ